MSDVVRRLNGWFTQAAVGRHLSYGAVRKRLTLIYGGLFVFSGAALMAIAYLLLVNAGFVFTLQPGATTPSAGLQATFPATSAGRGLAKAGQRTHPSALTMAYWRGGRQGCMRANGVLGFSESYGPCTGESRIDRVDR